MKRPLKWILICQLAAAVFCVIFVNNVRNGYHDALLQQGSEIGRSDTIEELQETGVDLPDNFRTLPNKDALIRPGMIELGQNLGNLIPAALLQVIAIGLTIKASRRAKEN